MNLSSISNLLLILALLPLHALAGGPYSAEPIEAWVVDKETGRPLEGVVVTANWELNYGTAGGSVPHGQLMVMEAVTDQRGRFHFPAWGPKAVPSFSIKPQDLRETLYLALFPVVLDLDVFHAPQLVLFKSGYKHASLANWNDVILEHKSGEYAPLRRSEWNGKTIKLELFKGTLQEYYSNDLMDLQIRIGFAYDSKNCEWKQVPRMIAALHRLSLKFDEQGVKLPIGVHVKKVDNIGVLNDSACGSVQDFFRSYLK